MADKINSITDLPLDILVLVFPYLDAKSFLALSSTCKSFHQSTIRLDPLYWSYLVRTTFRVPNQPVVQHDGDRWQKMYRRLLTQSRVFTWGNNAHNRLGHALEAGERSSRAMMRAPFARRMAHASLSQQPTEMENTRNLGVIADMQCGGWSTTLLTSKGSLHIAGVLDGQRVYYDNAPLEPLHFPKGYPSHASAAQYEEPAVAIRQFSSGRAHILALSDSGKVWSWYSKKQPALQVRFATLQLNELSLDQGSSASSSKFGQVRQVGAGWSRSSAYVHGVGIVVWDPVERDHDEQSTDTMLVTEHSEVPKSGYQRLKATRESDEQRLLGEEVGVVLSYIMLEHYVLFNTDIGKVFCGRFEEKNKIDEILELKQVRHEKGAPLDIQGSFRSFAIFRDGEVITSDQNYLESCWNNRREDPEQMSIQGLKKIPALQHNNVISVAFGDYHYLALHSNGKITSYGTENSGCGALGLGSNNGNIVSKARGLVYDQFNGNGRLLPHAYKHGRQVWFDNRKNDWLTQVMNEPADDKESEERRQLWERDHNVQGEVSEWFEQEARAWDQDGGEDGLGAYFALRVSAAGWHSGSLVLVNEELAMKEPTYNWERKPFPRLKMSDGTEMPGQKDLDEWREGCPDFQLDADHV
ncbi:regulator of chromosome condensation rcc1 [Pyrenophora seminiperda CCB06]|uniref:Regulator of chromosome condensation rcc1 n=1 Tax=Pyrenophora seminiperda CCB06 TaxID=1302712 RepID=A0A3M7M9N9_9PLEO|nr:regulator of chromosome condensation rcc1 [Pyrenophora seminiperda CCB06]